MNIEDIAVMVEGVWLPKDEVHMREWMTTGKKAYRKGNKITYQWGKQEAAMAICDETDPEWRRGVFVDVGGHCGFWSMWWGLECRGVIAFEPIDYLREIYRNNVPREVNVSLIGYALSDEDGELEMKVNPENTGATRVWAPGEDRPKGILTHRVNVTTLDHILPPHLSVRRMSVLKIDCEGFEEKVVRGGLEMIQTHRPVVIVEQKFENRHFDFERNGAVHALEEIGYRVAKEISGDHIMVPYV